MGENSPEESMDLQTPSEKQDGNIALPSSSSMAIDLQNQGKKPTRQWAAWTRQEEENFFNALRQVGKNFEKITCRVQSKNKDQVRHYYYRLVRRMNKLLGPEFCLDAKNSKDTIAAMLRWWSLLEKYSCTASKLHLKPRRFKTFIEALAHQLLKDRNKTRRKRSSLEENYSFIHPASASIMTRGSANDVDPVKLLFLDNQKIQKVGFTTKSSSSKGNNVSANNNCSKGGFSVAKSMKQSRRTGLIASAAYRRWEKAAVAGVSLVADAAEQLERTAGDRKGSSNQATFNALPPKDCVQEHNAGRATHLVPSPLSVGIHSSHLREMSVQPFAKLKLQLFPIDDITRKALEKDDHNPYLELTLSARKRISSIIEHLNCKWGKSSVASGELMLFPYDIQVDDLMNCQRWTLRDKVACASDVYGTVGRPDIFRLRYGWLSRSELESRSVQLPLPFFHYANNMQNKSSEGVVDNFVPDGKTLPVELQKDKSPEVENLESPVSGVSEVEIANISHKSKNIGPESLGPTSTSSLLQEEPRNEKEQHDDEEKLRSDNASVLFAGEWADSLTNISIGDLLSEASRAADSTCNRRHDGGSAPSVQNTPFSCDSFDAAIAAHMSGYNDLQSTSNQISHASIWDAEETCDEFSFERNLSRNREDPNSLHEVSNEPNGQILNTDTIGFHGLLKNVTETETTDFFCRNGLETKSQHNEGVSHDNRDNENNLGLADVYWPDSLGADLEIPSFPRYVAQDMIFGDSVSLNGLSRLIANSLDAFQNLSFCGSEERTPSANVVTSISSEVKSEE